VGALAVIASLGLLLLFECWLDGQQRRRAEEAALIRDRMARIRRGRTPVRLIAEGGGWGVRTNPQGAHPREMVNQEVSDRDRRREA